MSKRRTKYIFVSGGVISGLGKGITSASICFLLKSHGLKVAPVKCDAYVNIDAGTIRPQEHGEVFVTDDGIETDQDLGHYERFINENLTRAHYVTTGQIYQEVIRRERNFEYNGEDVEVVPHVPEEMIRRFKQAGKVSDADVVVIEIGGTVGEYQNILFLEANRIMKFRDKEEVLHVHAAFLPTPKNLGEMKSKPTQTSVRLLNETMIQPDFIVARAAKPIDQKRRQRIALFCNIHEDKIISAPYVESIYEIPLIFKNQDFDKKILKKLGLDGKRKTTAYFKKWRQMVKTSKNVKKKVKIAIAGKYQKTGEYILPDSYVCVVESIKHAGWTNKVKPEIIWINTETIEKNPKKIEELKKADGIIVPQGWGSRGVEGKIKVAQFARENKIPYLGLCFGMQMAVVEFGRNVLGLKGANSEEVNPKTPCPVIHIMPKQKEYLAKKQYGGTIRLGAWPCKLFKNSQTYDFYQKHGWLPKNAIVQERHRHRYEFNLKYKDRYQKAGFKISGVSPDKKLVEAVELDKSLHPFFIGVQFHPEYKSRPLNPHPLFLEFIRACLRKK